MNKKIITLTGIATLSYVAFMVAELPASFVWRHAPDIQGVSLQGVSGTLWSGEIEKASVSGVSLEDIRWAVKPLSLLQKQLWADIHLGNPFSDLAGSTSIRFDGEGIMAENLTVDASAAWLQQQSPVPVPVTIGGHVQLTANSLLLSGGQCRRLDADVVWDRGHIETPWGSLSSGKARATLDCQNGRLAGSLRQNSEYARTSASFSLDMASRGRVSYSLDGTIQDGEALPERLKRGMIMLGKPDNEGRYPLRFRGRI